MGSTMSFVWCMIALALAVMATTATASTIHKVGDDQGWRFPKDDPSFYTRWAANKTFIVGDKLEFIWTGTHNVVEVRKDEYGNCTEGETPLHELSPVTISLGTAGSKYFICAVVPHCSFGQKLSVIVESDISTMPPASAPSSAPTSLLANALYAAMLTITSMFFTCL
ncbi:umecyanin-like [Benincasa hispida]|uniref:umecyanin-like n=1 Tax=Benincasa hispida TaxID=102211 RepID=UPI0019024F47|nr:umecyanin-like [Benincasa hispida]